MKYRYYCKYRPPVPGSIPRKGLTCIADFDEPEPRNGIVVHGWAEYDRPLKEREMDDYDLVPADEKFVPTP